MQQMELYSPRLILKSITPAFITDIFTTKSEAEIKAYFGFDDSGYQHALQMHLQGMETHCISFHYFLLIDKQTQLPIGECGFHTWNKTHRRAELFYAMRSDEFKQKGFMTEAVKAVIEFGYSQMQLHRIAAFIDDNNTASKKLLLRYGFTKEGTMREDYCVDGVNEDSDCYSLLRWEWEKQPLS